MEKRFSSLSGDKEGYSQGLLRVLPRVIRPLAFPESTDCPSIFCFRHSVALLSGRPGTHKAAVHNPTTSLIGRVTLSIYIPSLCLCSLICAMKY